MIFFATGDLVERHGDGFRYRARKGFAFKLANGRWFHPEILESRLRNEFRANGQYLILPHRTSGRLLILCSDREALPETQRALAVAGNDWPGRVYVEELRHVPAEDFIVRPKGDIDRGPMVARFSEI